MKKKLLTTFTVATIFMVAGCGTDVKLKDGKEVIASIKDKEFTAEELFDELKEKHGNTVLTNMIDSYIINTEIKDDSNYEEQAKSELASMKSYYEQYDYNWNDVLSYYGFSTDEEFLKSNIENAKKTDIIKNALKEQVTEDEIKKYYEEEIYGDYTVKHILITANAADDSSDEDKKNAKETALNRAKEVIEKLNNGEKWNDLVKEYSDDDNTKENEGLLPSFTNGDYVDSFFNATIELEDKSYTKEPVESTYGYHIIYRVSATEKPSLEKAKETCLSKIVENKLTNDESLSAKTWIEIRNDYELDIVDSTIKDDYNKSISQ